MSMSFRFKEASRVVAVLEVLDPAGKASLEELYGVLLAIRVQLVRAAELDVGGGVVLELSLCELDGGKLHDARRRAILSELTARLGAGEHAPAPASGPRPRPLRAA